MNMCFKFLTSALISAMVLTSCSKPLLAHNTPRNENTEVYKASVEDILSTYHSDLNALKLSEKESIIDIDALDSKRNSR